MDSVEPHEVRNNPKLERDASASVEPSDLNATDKFEEAENPSSSNSDKRLTDLTTGSEQRDQQASLRPALSSAEINRSSSDINVSSDAYPLPKVNFAKLETSQLQDYCRFYEVSNINDGSTREQLLNAMNHHFVSQPPLKEEEVLSKFAAALRRRKNTDRRR